MVNKFLILLLPAVLLSSMLLAQVTSVAKDTNGILSDGNTYQNAILGITLKLPGSWQLREKGVAHSARASGCTGPLCGLPDVNVALDSTASDTHQYHLFLAAWKLDAVYRNRSRYPLQWFAQIMTTGSLGGSGLVPLGDLTAIQLDGRSAYRLLASEAGAKEPRTCGYVSESNGYVLLLVGSATSASDEPRIQTAIELLSFEKPAH
jgi:hypothetical protein